MQHALQPFIWVNAHLTESGWKPDESFMEEEVAFKLSFRITGSLKKRKVTKDSGKESRDGQRERPVDM